MVSEAEEEFGKAEDAKRLEEGRLKDLECFRIEKKVLQERLSSLYSRMEGLYREVRDSASDSQYG